MTQMLISVTDEHEAKIAIENGADIIDLKDPADGALGALAMPLVNRVVGYVNHAKLVSATIGNIQLQSNHDIQAAVNRIQALVTAGVDIIKIGFFESKMHAEHLNSNIQDEVLAALTTEIRAMCLQKQVKFVAVLFAENHYSKAFIGFLLETCFDGIMIDTMNKNGQNFLAYNDDDKFTPISKQVIAADAWFGVAGSLQPQDIVLAKRYKPTYIGFRSAACEDGNRKNSLSAFKVQALCKLM